MLEKDIENLIASFPKEFFPKEELTLISQQYTLEKRRIDILFEDKYKRYIIVEVKRGILSREASGQIIEYYGLLKNQFPDKNIELILCANTIPNERKLFLENVGIECKEIPVSKIVHVAKTNNYIFLDSKKYDSETVNFSKKKASGSTSASEKSNEEISAWIFQANPKEYDILNALSDDKLKNNIHWFVGQHKAKIKKGHYALIWMSGKEAGIYAVTKILTDPLETEEYEAEQKYWLNTSKETKKLLRVRLKIIKRFLNNPIFRNELKDIEGLQNLSILKFAQGTNFPVKDNEWEIISKLIT